MYTVGHPFPEFKLRGNVDEALRVLDALQTGQLTACGWTPGEPTLDAA